MTLRNLLTTREKPNPISRCKSQIEGWMIEDVTRKLKLDDLNVSFMMLFGIVMLKIMKDNIKNMFSFRQYLSLQMLTGGLFSLKILMNIQSVRERFLEKILRYHPCRKLLINLTFDELPEALRESIWSESEKRGITTSQDEISEVYSQLEKAESKPTADELISRALEEHSIFKKTMGEPHQLIVEYATPLKNCLEPRT